MQPTDCQNVFTGIVSSNQSRYIFFSDMLWQVESLNTLKSTGPRHKVWWWIVRLLSVTTPSPPPTHPMPLFWHDRKCGCVAVHVSDFTTVHLSSRSYWCCPSCQRIENWTGQSPVYMEADIKRPQYRKLDFWWPIHQIPSRCFGRATQTTWNIYHDCTQNCLELFLMLY